MSNNLRLLGPGAPPLYQTPTEVTRAILAAAAAHALGLAHDMAALADYRRWLHETLHVDAAILDEHADACEAYARGAQPSGSLVSYW